MYSRNPSAPLFVFARKIFRSFAAIQKALEIKSSKSISDGSPRSPLDDKSVVNGYKLKLQKFEDKPIDKQKIEMV